MRFIDILVNSNKWSVRILRHVLFWTIDCLSILVVISADNELNARIVVSRFLVIPLTASVTYFIIYYLIPSYSKDRNWAKFLIGIILSMLFVAYGIRYYRLEIIDALLYPDFVPASNVWHFNRIMRDTFRWMPGICVAIAIKMIKNRSELMHHTEQLLEEKKNAELAFLKAQMHPHFLFNTLNTLYSYAISNSPQSQTKSEQIVLQLSNLLRFILEECDKPLIVLKKEIKVIEDYIELQRLRHGDRINLVYKVDATNEEFVSPLLMLPIVENSFKHTLSSNRGKIEIQLSIKSEHGYVHLDLENDLIGQEKNVISFGKGLHSVRRQLELLYGTNFLLEIKMQTKSLSLV